MARRGRIALLGALALASCGQPAFQQPPAKYRGDVTAVVTFTANPLAACKGAGWDGTGNVAGCGSAQKWAVLPNPCTWPENESYAALACHEIGHVNRWPANHPKA